MSMRQRRALGSSVWLVPGKVKPRGGLVVAPRAWRRGEARPLPAAWRDRSARTGLRVPGHHERIVRFLARLAERVRELRLRALRDVALELVPGVCIVPDPLAVHADGKKTLEEIHLRRRL